MSRDVHNGGPVPRFDGSVALLTNFLPPYRIKMLESLQDSVATLRVFVSVRMETNRSWKATWGDLAVTVQRTLSVPVRFSHGGSFREASTIHFPYDTIPQLAKFRPDVVIAAEFGPRTLQAALYRLFARKSRLIVWATLSEVTEQHRGGGRRFLRGLVLKIADGVLVNGSSGANYIAGFDYPRTAIHVVPQNSDNETFAGPVTRPESPVTKLLSVGQLIERKGLVPFHDQLERWCALHPERVLRWTIIGKGPVGAELMRLQRSPNFELVLMDEVPFDQVRAHYHEADLFAFPTLADEWGLVVNEAMIAGLPVLGSVYSQAVLDLVIEGESGWRFRPDHVEVVHQAIGAALAADAETLNRMRQAAVDALRPLDAAGTSARIVRALHAVSDGTQVSN